MAGIPRGLVLPSCPVFDIKTQRVPSQQKVPFKTALRTSKIYFLVKDKILSKLLGPGVLEPLRSLIYDKLQTK